MTEAQRAYVRDLPRWEAEGWKPSMRNGRIVVLATPTGTQTYVWREVKS